MIAEVRLLKVVSVRHVLLFCILLPQGFGFVKLIQEPVDSLTEVDMPLHGLAQAMAHDPQVEKRRSLSNFL